MEHFCTLFDIRFLPQGMALHASLQRHAGSYALWILCMDDAVGEALGCLALPNVRLISLRDIETPTLLAVKAGRSKAEYCWTLTPFLPKAVMDRDITAQRVTYVDADCWFVNDPRRIIQEMDEAGKDVLITLHDYLPEHDQSETSGRFCVQFVPFKRTSASLEVLAWWQERCLEWCFSRIENDRFGDQKYLDQWPGLFPQAVHVLKNTQLTMAPWNAARYKDIADFQRTNCMYHFHGLRIFRGELVCLCLVGGYSLPENILRIFYQPYLSILSQNICVAASAGVKLSFPSSEPYRNIYARLKDLARGIIKNKWRIWCMITKDLQ